MKYFFLLFASWMLIINAAIAKDLSKTLGQFVGGIKSDAVWDHHLLQANYLEQICHGSGNCTAKILQKLGASSQAIAFAQWTGGLITSCQRYGSIYYFVAWLPGSILRMSVFIGNNAGQLLQIDHWLDKDQPSPMVNRKTYLKLLARHYHNTATRYGVELVPEYQIISANIQQLIFNYPLIDRCKGIDGSVKIGFQFNKQGQFIQAKFLTITSHAPAYKAGFCGR